MRQVEQIIYEEATEKYIIYAVHMCRDLGAGKASVCIVTAGGIMVQSDIIKGGDKKEESA